MIFELGPVTLERDIDARPGDSLQLAEGFIAITSAEPACSFDVWWADPVAAVSKDGFTHSLDKDWSTIDPKDTKRIYVSYTDFDGSFSSAACGANFRTAIEFVESEKTLGKGEGGKNEDDEYFDLLPNI